MRGSLLIVFPVALALTGCEPAPEPDDSPTPRLPSAAATGPSPEELTALDSRDCREVAEGYLDAVSRKAWDDAAMYWDDPVIDGERIAALFHGYATPQIEVADIQEEGAAGTLHCTVTGALTDASDPQVAPRQGEIVLSRVNNVPGASAQQLRWTIRSSTFVEPMQRAGRGEIA